MDLLEGKITSPLKYEYNHRKLDKVLKITKGRIVWS